MRRWTVEQVLECFDQCNVGCLSLFPNLSSPSAYLIDARLSVFSIGLEWKVVFETIRFNPRMGGHHGIFDELVCFASDGTAAQSRIGRITFDEVPQTFLAEHNHEVVNPRATSVGIRGISVSLPTATEYRQRRVDPDEDGPTTWQLMRCIASIFPGIFFEPVISLNVFPPRRLPLVLQLHEWNHPDLNEEELPSRSETFQQVAEVALTADRSRYRPTQPPNSAWWLREDRVL